MSPTDAERLSVALGATKPLPADRAEIEIDLLVPAYKRVTVNDHESFRKSLDPKPETTDQDL